LAPALFVFLVGYVAIAGVAWPGEDYLREAAFAAVYMVNYYIVWSGVAGNASHTWSLAVEAQFYLVWPLLYWLMADRTAGERATVAFGLYLSVTGLRIAEIAVHADWIPAYYNTHTHASGLFLGCALAMLSETDAFRRRDFRVAGLVGSAALISAVPFAVFGDVRALVLWVPAVEIGTALIIAALSTGHDGRLRRVLSAEPLPLIGLLSYSLYLWHYPLARLWREEMPWYWTAALVIVLSFGCAGLSYVLIEKPVNRWRRGRVAAVT
jgi:peptidoglycan/LPS O-acetylase OafA/YrhL